jgi:hypothetical protein
LKAKKQSFNLERIESLLFQNPIPAVIPICLYFVIDKKTLNLFKVKQR